MPCDMSDYDWEVWENCNPPTETEIVNPNIEEARSILAGNAGWYTQAQIAWALKQI